MHEQLRILVVDDSTMMRRVLRSLLESDPTLRVVGEAANGREALAYTVSLRPDVIIMDVRMPVMDGIETTEQLMAYHPTPILALTASLSHYDVNITFKMLGAGALDVMEKPALDNPGAVDQARRELIRRIKLLARVQVVTHLRGRRRNSEQEHGERMSKAEPTSDTERRAVRPSQRVSIASPNHPLVVIGASTGGPQVVRQILSQCSPPFPAAILVVQHIAAGFCAGFVEWLQTSCTLPIHLAAEGDRLVEGEAYVAPDSYDLLVRAGGRIHLTDRQLQLQRPAIDVAMQSAAEIFGERTIGVLLTGMGRDGAIGMQAIKRVGGTTLAQDEASCAIYGMPKAAVTLGVVDAVLTPDEISRAMRTYSEQAVKGS